MQCAERNVWPPPLGKAGAPLMTPVDAADLLESVLALGTQLLGAPHGFIALAGSDEPDVTFKLGIGAFDGVDDEAAPSRIRQLAEQVRRSGQPEVVPVGGAEQSALFPGGEAVGAMSVSPLLSGPRIVGVVGMAYDAGSPRSFGPTELEQLSSLCNLASFALDNARLYGVEKHSRLLADRLRASAQAINQSLDLDVVLPAIMDQLHEVIEYDSGTIQILERDSMRVIAMRGFPPSELGRVRALTDYAYNRRLAQNPEPIVEGDVLSATFWQTDPLLDKIRSNLGVPLVVRDRIIGALTVDSHEPNRYTAEDAETAMAFARHAAIAIEHARLFSSECAARDHAERLRAATQALSSTIDLQEVFELILSELRKVVPYHSASVLELKGNRLELIGGHGFPVIRGLLGVSFDIMAADNPNGDVMRNRAPVILEDAPARYPNFAAEPHRQAGIRAWMGVPLLFGDRLIGMLAVDNREPGFYTAEHAGLAMSFAAQAAIAIEHARLFADAQRELAERKDAQQRLNYLANFDPVTGLPNRTLLADRLRQAQGLARRELKVVGLLYLDLDRFKNVNDTLGHAAGDQLLKAVGERLGTAVRDGDSVARLAGDEFILVLSMLDRAQDGAWVAETICELFAKPFVVGGHEIFVSASIGVAVAPTDGSADLEALLKEADAAMYRAKEEGGNTYRVFTADAMRSVERLDFETEMRHAMDREEFLLHYQPLVDVSSGQVIGVEALLRWPHPTRGFVVPSDIIRLAEETGLIVPLGGWVLQQACHQGRAWQEAGYAGLRIAVNVSARQLSSNLVQTVRSILDETGMQPSSLLLEITETVLIQNPDVAIAAVHELNALGIAFALDDFGVGYSSLSQFRRFPFDMLKIDQSFVRDIPTDLNDAGIVTAIIAMAHALGVAVIAEGVENEDQLAFLTKGGCDAIQGYLVGRPLGAAEFEATFLATGPAEPPVALSGKR